MQWDGVVQTSYHTGYVADVYQLYQPMQLYAQVAMMYAYPPSSLLTPPPPSHITQVTLPITLLPTGS